MRIHSKMFTKIQPKRRIIEDKMSMRIHQKCQQEFNYFLHKHLPFTSTRSLPPQLHIRHNFHSKNWVSYVCHYKIFVKFTYLIGMIADQKFYDIFYVFILRLRLWPTTKGRSLSGTNIWLRPMVKIVTMVQHCNCICDFVYL